VGKIFDALEKFSKERGGPVVDRFKNSDYEALMKFDEATGRIDVADPSKNLFSIKKKLFYPGSKGPGSRIGRCS
jgi:hypothetical protein